MKVLFHNKTLNFRGVTNSIVDYAHYNQEILGNESTLIYCPTFPASGIDTGSKSEVIDKLCQTYNVLTYQGEKELNKIAEKYDVVYTQKAGHFDDDFVTSTRTAIHAVFQYYQPHGDSYAYISEWLAREMNQLCPEDVLKWVPYIINLPPIFPTLKESTRDIFGIPRDAFVIGRHGGLMTFDIAWVNKMLPELCEKYPNLYFLMANTNVVFKHPRIIEVPAFFGSYEKTVFISACDAAIHGRKLGESFGAAICENLFHDIPVLAAYEGFDRNHIELLEKHGLIYDITNLDQKIESLMLRKTYGTHDKYKEIVSQFTPPKVMEKFKSVFLDY
jgi:hypothetical protein